MTSTEEVDASGAHGEPACEPPPGHAAERCCRVCAVCVPCVCAITAVRRRREARGAAVAQSVSVSRKYFAIRSLLKLESVIAGLVTEFVTDSCRALRVHRFFF